jgi:FtsZ-interacting cell division protein ZipA
MKKRLTACMLACFMILLVGCSSNTAKEAAKNKTKTETSFPAGNTETQSQEETSTEQESTVVQEKTQNTTDESKKADENRTLNNVQSKPAEEKSSGKPKAEPSKRTNTPTVSEKHTEQLKEPTSGTQKPTEKPKEPKSTEPPKQTFDVGEYVSYAKNYAQSIGLEVDSTATECWDNPITANSRRTGIKDDIKSRLNRYKNVEGFTAVWVWAEKVSDTEYEIYIGYC